MKTATYNIYFDTPRHLPEHDQSLIDAAHQNSWEYIEPDAAETQEGRNILHAILTHKYHLDEGRCGMI